MDREVYYEGERVGRELERRFWDLAGIMVGDAGELGVVSEAKGVEVLGNARRTDDLTMLLKINAAVHGIDDVAENVLAAQGAAG